MSSPAASFYIHVELRAAPEKSAVSVSVNFDKAMDLALFKSADQGAPLRLPMGARVDIAIEADTHNPYVLSDVMQKVTDLAKTAHLAWCGVDTDADPSDVAKAWSKSWSATYSGTVESPDDVEVAYAATVSMVGQS